MGTKPFPHIEPAADLIHFLVKRREIRRRFQLADSRTREAMLAEIGHLEAQLDDLTDRLIASVPGATDPLAKRG